MSISNITILIVRLLNDCSLQVRYYINALNYVVVVAVAVLGFNVQSTPMRRDLGLKSDLE